MAERVPEKFLTKLTGGLTPTLPGTFRTGSADRARSSLLDDNPKHYRERVGAWAAGSDG